jgi:hypothetical protein
LWFLHSSAMRWLILLHHVCSACVQSPKVPERNTHNGIRSSKGQVMRDTKTAFRSWAKKNLPSLSKIIILGDQERLSLKPHMLMPEWASKMQHWLFMIKEYFRLSLMKRIL